MSILFNRRIREFENNTEKKSLEKRINEVSRKISNFENAQKGEYVIVTRQKIENIAKENNISEEDVINMLEKQLI